MKNLIITCLALVTLMTSSCRKGGSNLETASSRLSGEGILVSKEPTDFDEWFGVKLKVYTLSEDHLRTYDDFWVSKKTWKRLPSPKDSVSVVIEYLSEIDAGTDMYKYENVYSGHHLDTLRSLSLQADTFIVTKVTH